MFRGGSLRHRRLPRSRRRTLHLTGAGTQSRPSVAAGRHWLPAEMRRAAPCRRLAAGEVLFHQGDPCVAIFEVEAGRVQLVRHDAGGHLLVLFNAGHGEGLAEAALFSAHYHCDAIATRAAAVRVHAANRVARSYGTTPRSPLASWPHRPDMTARILRQAHAAWVVAKKDAVVYYLKPPVINFGIILPLLFYLAF
ncbi:MAG: cyclic nucleotide-binding domain-containing protein, partial [Alphaproteobacteria bacterium]|nr:cyclic nucleotide-binding domain-containing protein [Alphaproteobacteria bacterium]